MTRFNPPPWKINRGSSNSETITNSAISLVSRLFFFKIMFSMFCNLFHFQTVNSKVSEQPSYFLHPFSEKRGYTGKRLSVFQSVIRPIQFLLRFFRNYKPKYFQFELKYQASREHVILCDAFLGKLLVYFLLNIFIYSLTHW